MSRVPAIALLLLLPALACAQTPQGGKQKKLYCWNEGSERICSDALPAEAVNHARDEFNASSGLRNAQVQRALSEDERAAASSAAALDRLDQMAAQTRQRTEQAMLVTYANEDDLRRVFSERKDVIDNNLRTAAYNVASLRGALVSLLGTAGDRELSGREVPDKDAAAIRQQHAQLLAQQRLQLSFEQQRQALDGEIEATLQRYRELKGAAPGG